MTTYREAEMLDMAMYAIQDCARYWRNDMTREDAENSVRVLLTHLLDREPTEDELIGVM